MTLYFTIPQTFCTFICLLVSTFLPPWHEGTFYQDHLPLVLFEGFGPAGLEPLTFTLIGSALQGGH